MNRERHSFSDLMGIMLLVAFDAVSLSLLVAYEPVLLMRTEHLVLVVLPMANVLAFAYFLMRGRPESGQRRFWVGFTVFGAIALLMFLCVAMACPRQLYHFAADDLGARSDPRLPVSALPFAAIFMVPQLLLALFGGVLLKTYRVHLTVHLERLRTDRQGSAQVP